MSAINDRKIIHLHPQPAPSNTRPQDKTHLPEKFPHDAQPPNDIQSSESAQAPKSQEPSPDQRRLVEPPHIQIGLDMNRVVFLITDLDALPELDVHPVDQCQLRFHMLPGLLLTSPNRQIVYPLLLEGKVIPVMVQLLQAAMENENPFFGLSMFVRITQALEYMKLVPPQISARIPYSLVEELFPREAADIIITDDMLPRLTEAELMPERAATLRAQIPIRVDFSLPTGYPLPEIYSGKIVRLSLSLRSRTGSLALNDKTVLPVNSLSRPALIHVGSAGFTTLPDDYYHLHSTGWERPVSSKLPDFYEDYTDITDPMAGLLARHGIKP